MQIDEVPDILNSWAVVLISVFVGRVCFRLGSARSRNVADSALLLN